jgi:hypothetical protein
MIYVIYKRSCKIQPHCLWFISAQTRCQSVCLSVYLSIWTFVSGNFSLCFCLSLFRSLNISVFFLSSCVSKSLFFCLNDSLFIYLSAFLFSCLSTSPFLCFSSSVLLCFSASLCLCFLVSLSPFPFSLFLYFDMPHFSISPFLSLCFPFLLLHISVPLFLSFHVCLSIKIWSKKSNNEIDEFTNLLIPFGNLTYFTC